MPDDAYDWNDQERFMNEHFKPFLEKFDAHLAADDRRFELMTAAVQRISVGIEVSAAVQQAQVTQTKAQMAQTERIFKSRWARLAVVVAGFSPLLTAAVAVWIALHPAARMLIP